MTETSVNEYTNRSAFALSVNRRNWCRRCLTQRGGESNATRGSEMIGRDQILSREISTFRDRNRELSSRARAVAAASTFPALKAFPFAAAS